MNSFYKAKLYNLKGLTLFYAHEYDKSEEFYNLSLNHFESSDSSKWTINVMLNFSTLYSQQFQFEKAASCIYEAKAIADKINDPLLKAKIATFFGHINYKQVNLSAVLTHLESAIENYHIK